MRISIKDILMGITLIRSILDYFKKKPKPDEGEKQDADKV